MTRRLLRLLKLLVVSEKIGGECETLHSAAVAALAGDAFWT